MIVYDALDAAERSARRVGFVAVFTTLAAILWGLWRGTRRRAGRTSGREPTVLRTRAFYLLASTGYFGLCIWLWRPLPWRLSQTARILALINGSLLYFTGLGLILWGRLTLGAMYNVSSTFGARLYAGHRLVTCGPYALVRHPMYLGVLVTAAGGILLYRTWTFLFLLLQFPALLVRARREEKALAAEFGERWAAYCRRVPAWLPGFLPSPADGEIR